MLDDDVAATWDGLCPSCASPMQPIPAHATGIVLLKCFDCGLTTL